MTDANPGPTDELSIERMLLTDPGHLAEPRDSDGPQPPQTPTPILTPEVAP